MLYCNGEEIRLGDTVRVPVPAGEEVARVVMLGDSRRHLALDPDFLDWVGNNAVLNQDAVVIEWIKTNPFSHNNPEYSLVGSYMFCAVDEYVSLVSRAAT